MFPYSRSRLRILSLARQVRPVLSYPAPVRTFSTPRLSQVLIRGPLYFPRFPSTDGVHLYRQPPLTHFPSFRSRSNYVPMTFIAERYKAAGSPQGSSRNGVLLIQVIPWTSWYAPLFCQACFWCIQLYTVVYKSKQEALILVL